MRICGILIRLHLLALVALLSFSGVTVARAQVARDSTLSHWVDPAIATVVLVSTLPDTNARALVIRRPGPLPNNIILVTTATAPGDLSRAVTALAFSVRNQGDRVTREMRTIIRPSASAKGKPSRDEARATADLARLRSAPVFDIAGVAQGPAVVVRMSDSALRRKARTP